MMTVEQIAMLLHDTWMTYMWIMGWRLGPRDDEARTHPHMLRWDELPEASREGDRAQATAVVTYIQSGKPIVVDGIAEAINDGWAAYTCAHGRPDHPRLNMLWDESVRGRNERLFQAWEILKQSAADGDGGSQGTRPFHLLPNDPRA